MRRKRKGEGAHVQDDRDSEKGAVFFLRLGREAREKRDKMKKKRENERENEER